MIVPSSTPKDGRDSGAAVFMATSHDDGLGDLHHQRHERVIVTQLVRRGGT